MSSSSWLQGVESRDFSQAEKKRNACKAEQIYKMTTIFTQNDNLELSLNYHPEDKIIIKTRSSSSIFAKLQCSGSKAPEYLHELELLGSNSKELSDLIKP